MTTISTSQTTKYDLASVQSFLQGATIDEIYAVKGAIKNHLFNALRNDLSKNLAVPSLRIECEVDSQHDDEGSYYEIRSFELSAGDVTIKVPHWTIDNPNDVMEDLAAALEDGNDGMSIFDLFNFPLACSPVIAALKAGITPENIYETEEASASKDAIVEQLGIIFNAIAGLFEESDLHSVNLTQAGEQP